MATRASDTSSSYQQRHSNVVGPERWLSILGGLGLTLAAMRGGALRRAALGVAGASLLTRGATRYCPMKAAATGQAPLSKGFGEQMRRMTSALGAGTAAASIHSMEDLYRAELQELGSAESQLIEALEQLDPQIPQPELRQRLQDYRMELQARCREIEQLLQSRAADPAAHPDEGMEALVLEMHKMLKIPDSDVRDAALAASVQRIIHYKIAGYGSIAAYAKALGREDEAARFAEYSDRDKTIDGELSEIAKRSLNPLAARTAAAQGMPAGVEGRAH